MRLKVRDKIGPSTTTDLLKPSAEVVSLPPTAFSSHYATRVFEKVRVYCLRHDIICTHHGNGAGHTFGIPEIVPNRVSVGHAARYRSSDQRLQRQDVDVQPQPKSEVWILRSGCDTVDGFIRGSVHAVGHLKGAVSGA